MPENIIRPITESPAQFLHLFGANAFAGKMFWVLGMWTLQGCVIQPEPIQKPDPIATSAVSSAPKTPTQQPASSPSLIPSSSSPTPGNQVIQIQDITPAELVTKRLQALTVSQEPSPTLYFASSQGDGTQNGIYVLREHQPLDFIALRETALSPRSYAGELFYLDLNCIKKLSLSKRTATVLAGTCGISGYGYQEGVLAQARFNEPSFLTLNAEGQLYIADTLNLRIRMLQNEMISTYVGKWIGTDHPTEGLNYSCQGGVCKAGGLTDLLDKTYYFSQGEPAGEPIQPFIQVNDVTKPGTAAKLLSFVQDGDRRTATFWRPGKLALDSQGFLYVYDHIAAQEMIRRISPDGQVMTLITNTNHPDPTHPEASGYLQAPFALDNLSAREAGPMCAFTVSGSILYIFGNSLYALNLNSKKWSIVIKKEDLDKYRQFGDPAASSPGVASFDSDLSGNLYVLFTKGEGLNGSRNKVLKIALPQNL